jgi:hypothetical protein
MESVEQMIKELQQMEFCIEVDNCVSDSDPIEAILYYLTQGQTITISIWKDHRWKNDK